MKSTFLLNVIGIFVLALVQQIAAHWERELWSRVLPGFGPYQDIGTRLVEPLVPTLLPTPTAATSPGPAPGDFTVTDDDLPDASPSVAPNPPTFQLQVDAGSHSTAEHPFAHWVTGGSTATPAPAPVMRSEHLQALVEARSRGL